MILLMATAVQASAREEPPWRPPSIPRSGGCGTFYLLLSAKAKGTEISVLEIASADIAGTRVGK
jgi:hypothetical protein